MKKLMIVAVMTMATVCAQAQSDVEAYFTTKEMPDMLKWCPAPPDTVGAAFTYDIMQYMWGKQMRQDKERAAIAIRDAVYGLDCKVLRDGTATCDSICKLPKKYYMRRRPFMRMQEPTLYPQDEPALRKNGSYPSGHTILGWSSALLLSEINPDRADTILARGYMYGESRVIVGAHWQSDVDAGRLAASAAYARLHTSERFLKQMRLARLEYRCKAGLATPAEVKAYKKAKK